MATLVHRKRQEDITDAADESRLLDELAELKALDPNLRDWRKLDPADIETYYLGTKESPESRGLLAKAIFVGTAQACLRGRYWAPSYSCEGAVEVQCKHLGSPISQLLIPDKLPPLKSRLPEDRTPKISCYPRCHPLDAGARLSVNARHIAVVRFTAAGDRRNELIRYGHIREDQVFLRTTYYQSFERMETEIHAPIGESLDLGALIFTPDIALLRGPAEEGALWYEEPPRYDIIWVAVPPRPQLAEQSQYAHEKDKNDMERVIDRIFCWAAAKEVDTLVMPPVGCGSHGCLHPMLDVADIIRRAAERHKEHIEHVCVASDLPSHFDNDIFTEFTSAVQNGRPQITKVSKVPVPPFPRNRKSPQQLADKYKRLNRVRPRSFRHTFL